MTKWKVSPIHLKLGREIAKLPHQVWGNKIQAITDEYGTENAGMACMVASAIYAGAIEPVEVWQAVGWKEKQNGN